MSADFRPFSGVRVHPHGPARVQHLNPTSSISEPTVYVTAESGSVVNLWASPRGGPSVSMDVEGEATWFLSVEQAEEIGRDLLAKVAEIRAAALAETEAEPLAGAA